MSRATQHACTPPSTPFLDPVNGKKETHTGAYFWFVSFLCPFLRSFTCIAAERMPQDNKLAQRPLTIEKLSTPFVICGCIQIPEGCKREIYRVAANAQGSHTAFAIAHEMVQTLTSCHSRNNTFSLDRDHGRDTYSSILLYRLQRERGCIRSTCQHEFLSQSPTIPPR
jgi:hypothetical protein